MPIWIKILKCFLQKEKYLQGVAYTCHMLILQTRNKGKFAQQSMREALHQNEALAFPETFPQLPEAPKKPVKRRKLWGIVHPQNLGCWAQHFETKRRNSCWKHRALWESVPPQKSLIVDFLRNANLFNFAFSETAFRKTIQTVRWWRIGKWEEVSDEKFSQVEIGDSKISDTKQVNKSDNEDADLGRHLQHPNCALFWVQQGWTKVTLLLTLLSLDVITCHFGRKKIPNQKWSTQRKYHNVPSKMI